jgi:hypothetical protein
MNARLPCHFVFVLGAVIAACTRSETPSAADGSPRDDGALAAMPRDADVDAMKSDAERQVDRFRAAAHRICREICECASSIVGATTYCSSGSNECCTEHNYFEEDGHCELAYFETFTRMAGLCAERNANPHARETCVCEAVEYCLTWAERTECPDGARPFETIIKHPWICFGHNTEDRNFCCDFQQSTCDFIEQNR